MIDHEELLAKIIARNVSRGKTVKIGRWVVRDIVGANIEAALFNRYGKDTPPDKLVIVSKTGHRFDVPPQYLEFDSVPHELRAA